MQNNIVFQFKNKSLYNLLSINTYFVFINIIYIFFYKQNMQKNLKNTCSAVQKKNEQNI